jgi:hypothetical protein
MNCIVCGFDELDTVFFHKNGKNNENHYLCNDCMETTLVVCTCRKVFNEEPKTVMFVCPCDSDSGTYEKIYVDITKEENKKHFEKFLVHHSKEYYGIPCCRGCYFTKNKIEKNILLAKQAAIDFCIYSKKDDKYTYEGDSLEQAFINACNKFGIQLNIEATNI